MSELNEYYMIECRDDSEYAADDILDGTFYQTYDDAVEAIKDEGRNRMMYKITKMYEVIKNA